MAEVPIPPIEEPLAELERRLISEYIRNAGHDPAVVAASHEPAARALRAEASVYAASKLAEVEARSHYVREMHGVNGRD